ncbi:MAG: aminotransferase [Myxococcota bacterium]|nr:aminotransferase [Myxococcota bacterium]
MSLKAYDTQQIWQQDRDHAIHPHAHLPTSEQEGCLIMARGEGAYVYDTEGRKYLDGIAGLWCVNVGHGRAEIAQVMADQAKELGYFSSFTDISNPPHAALARKISEIAPEHLNHVHFSSGGSDANEAIARTMHHYFHRLGKPSKRLFIARIHAYHGTTFLTASLSGKPGEKGGFHFANDWVHHVEFPGLYRAPREMAPAEHLDQLAADFEKKIHELGAENVAGFFAEPIMGAGGVLTAPDGYHRRMKEICDAHEILYASDEVVTGFGRLGHFFASGPVFGIEPDFIAAAKGLTSGYFPLGASLISDKVYDVIKQPTEDSSYYSQGWTYSGHPIGCAVALENIRIMEDEGILENVREVGPYFEEKLATLRDLRLVGDTRGSHFMTCVEYVADKESKALLPEEANIARRIADHGQKRGIIVRPIGQLNILSPPLIVDRAQIDFLVDALRESAEAATADLVAEGYLD